MVILVSVGLMTVHIDTTRHTIPPTCREEDDLTPVPEATILYGKLSFVDLAGSERLKESKSVNAGTHTSIRLCSRVIYLDAGSSPHLARTTDLSG